MTEKRQVASLLQGASELDKAARDLRREAGALLADMRSQNAAGWRCGLDQRTAELLIEMSASGRVNKGGNVGR